MDLDVDPATVTSAVQSALDQLDRVAANPMQALVAGLFYIGVGVVVADFVISVVASIQRRRR